MAKTLTLAFSWPLLIVHTTFYELDLILMSQQCWSNWKLYFLVEFWSDWIQILHVFHEWTRSCTKCFHDFDVYLREIFDALLACSRLWQILNVGCFSQTHWGRSVKLLYDDNCHWALHFHTNFDDFGARSRFQRQEVKKESCIFCVSSDPIDLLSSNSNFKVIVFITSFVLHHNRWFLNHVIWYTVVY